MQYILKQILFNKKIHFHLLFWAVITIYYTSSRWPYESNKSFLFEKTIITVLIHLSLAYTIMFFLVPRVLYKKRKVLFGVSCLVTVYVAFVFFEGLRIYYLVPKFAEVFKLRPPLVFKNRITDIFSFLNHITSYVFPTIILMVFEYYRHQKEVYQLKDQKKTIELEALKNQLNPHFLFNTLNNLYILSLEKSDEVPEVIDKLSDILDYILFRCNEKFVPLENEMTLLKNYISLEKLRYGKRLNIEFEYDNNIAVKIAPLLLLTFLENAFKHGVSQEIKKATIKIKLKTKDKNIHFYIENSKPLSINEEITQKDRQSLGLKNIKTQLHILYPKRHLLFINNEEQKFTVNLNITSE